MIVLVVSLIALVLAVVGSLTASVQFAEDMIEAGDR